MANRAAAKPLAPARASEQPRFLLNTEMWIGIGLRDPSVRGIGLAFQVRNDKRITVEKMNNETRNRMQQLAMTTVENRNSTRHSI
jgi:hypothetical protein